MIFGIKVFRLAFFVSFLGNRAERQETVRWTVLAKEPGRAQAKEKLKAQDSVISTMLIKTRSTFRPLTVKPAL